jgi:L-ascorbate metabolism protein UlaG (beta-lactamase superfamily)
MTALASPGLRAQPAEDTLESAAGPIVVHAFEHASFVLQWSGKTVYVDPVGGGDRYSELPPADVVLLTHVHGDHTSADTLAAVAGEHTETVAPATVSDELGGTTPGRVTVLAIGETFERHGITVEAVPAYNLTEERLKYHPKARKDNGYVVTMGGTRIYVSGDTEDIPEMRALTDIDAAFVCMNLPYTMTVERAADAVLEFKPRVVYPYHYRGQGGMSDLDAFRSLVAADPTIDVRFLKWY